VFAVNGNSPAGRGQNQGQVFVQLKDWSVRQGAGQTVQALLARVQTALRLLPGRDHHRHQPAADPRLGTSAGFDFELEDRGGIGHDDLMKARDQLLQMAARDPDIAQLRPNGSTTPRPSASRWIARRRACWA
jgi:multidrug efflux pump